MTLTPAASRVGLLACLLLIISATFAYAGPRSALLMAIGLGFGLTLEGLRFGFAGPWRQLIVDRDSRGMVAQLMAIAVTAAVCFPLLAIASEELSGAHAPIGLAMIVGAFVFGATMQVVLGCGSGTLVNAASGNFVALLALPGFVAGSFLATLHLDWWTGFGTLPVLSLQGLFGTAGGLLLTLSGLMLLLVIALIRARAGLRLPGSRLWLAAMLLAILAVLHLVISGQSWGIVYGLGLWGAKLSQAGGLDLATTAYWSATTNAERLQQSVFTDVTSLTNIGIMLGAFIVMQWRRAGHNAKSDTQTETSVQIVIAMLLAGLVLGYSSRIAFGCNVGAYFSGIATGSLHGWVWLIAAFAGAILGVRIRTRLQTTASSRAESHRPPTRQVSAIYTLVLLTALLITDYRNARILNPFAAPPPAALGSGLQPQGAHCTDF
ncbi:YeeE/YedE family protein [Pseudohongiella spirulinae]|uniref:YeeE/YedE n=1 Tax=Pseudohongiella spirulinae TaxID=1249552 RepID=A0A0S2KC35_9GAMM|nr:YeeE/YedE family protein [Pseudohongiella spirulinae]ALO45856.1 YeeE/YedE [Pseudohongiella spirulinae]